MPEPMNTPSAAEPARILIVDPDSDTRTFVRTFLGGHGFRVVQAGSADQGIETARNVRPDLMIVDALLPHEGAVLVRRALPEMPMIFISALPQSSLFFYRQLSESGGRTAVFLEKPLQADELLDRISRLDRKDH